jgi:hypothetical protein
MPPELDQMNSDSQNNMPLDMTAQADTLPSGETDREGAMAKADLYKLANYSHKLFQQIQDEDQLEGWVQAKITKAADYIASVYHYLEYEMKFSEYGKALDDSDVLSEGQKRVLKTRLNEAKSKVKELKKVQAEKVKDKAMAEGAISGGHTACAECGGSGMVYEEPKAIPDHVKSKVEKYKRQATAFHAAGKRIDANKNGIPDDEEMEEDFDALKKTGDTTKTSRGNTVTKTDTGIKHERPASTYNDGGDDISSNAKSGKGVKSHAKGETAAEKKAKSPALKQSPKSAKTWGMKDSEKFDNRDGAPAKPKKPKEEKTDETYGLGVYEATKLKGNQKNLDVDNDDDIEADDLAALRAGKKKVKEESHQAKTTMKHVNASGASDKTKAAIKKASKDIKPGTAGYKDREDALKAAGVKDDRGPANESAKPSAGLSAAKKSAVVKDAKAGKDIGKPGKSFDKLAKSAGGGEKGTKVAAAAMWKNMKESVKVEEAEKKAKRDYDEDGKIETGAEEHAGSVDKAIKAKAKETVKESADMTRMKEFLTRLNG